MAQNSVSPPDAPATFLLTSTSFLSFSSNLPVPPSFASRNHTLSNKTATPAAVVPASRSPLTLSELQLRQRLRLRSGAVLVCHAMPCLRRFKSSHSPPSLTHPLPLSLIHSLTDSLTYSLTPLNTDSFFLSAYQEFEEQQKQEQQRDPLSSQYLWQSGPLVKSRHACTQVETPDLWQSGPLVKSRSDIPPTTATGSIPSHGCEHREDNLAAALAEIGTRVFLSENEASLDHEGCRDISSGESTPPPHSVPLLRSAQVEGNEEDGLGEMLMEGTFPPSVHDASEVTMMSPGCVPAGSLGSPRTHRRAWSTDPPHLHDNTSLDPPANRFAPRKSFGQGSATEEAAGASWISSMWTASVRWWGNATPPASGRSAGGGLLSVTADTMVLDVKSWMLMPIENGHASPEVPLLVDPCFLTEVWERELAPAQR